VQNLFVFLYWLGSGFWVLGSGGLFLEVDGITEALFFLPRERTRSARNGPWFFGNGRWESVLERAAVVRGGARWWFSFLPPERSMAVFFWAHPAPSSYYSPSPFSCFSRSPDNLLSRTTYIPPCQKFWILRFLSSASDLIAVAASFGVSACRSAPRLPAVGLTHRAFSSSIFLTKARLLCVHVSCVLRIIYSLSALPLNCYTPQQHLFNGAIFIKPSQNAEDMACARLLLSCSCFNGHGTVRYINYFSFICLHERKV